ncbi:MAG: polysaccharide deacetylase family protein, partial [Candidatus Saccharimonadales bacterium]
VLRKKREVIHFMKRNRKFIYWVIAIVVVIAAAVGAARWYCARPSSNGENQRSFSSSSSASGHKTIYLTFDMDMNEFMYNKTLLTDKQWYDPAVFSYLEQHHIPASFFVSGLFAVAYPDLMKDLAATDQFSFENHSYDESSFTPHCYWLTPLGSDSVKTAQIEVTARIIQSFTGQTSKYFRFPGICHDKASDALVEHMGYTINDGTVVPSDPFNNNTAKMVRTVMSEAKSGATIIMHVGGHNAPKSFALLKQIIPKLQAEGYVLEKL